MRLALASNEPKTSISSVVQATGLPFLDRTSDRTFPNPEYAKDSAPVSCCS
jgi:hypothetical protein